MEKIFYLHLSYRTSNGVNASIDGDMLLAVKEGTKLGDIRKQVWQKCRTAKPEIEWQSPTIISITELSKELYESLHS